MKHMLKLIPALALLACNACHPLEAVADKVPLQLTCVDHDKGAAEKALSELIDNIEQPKVVWDRYVEMAKHDAAGVACLVLDARDVAQQTLANMRADGLQGTEQYRKLEAALEVINDGLEALNLK